MSPIEVLRHYWHHDTFRPLQEEIINSVLDGNDTMALLPTGGGKSVCYQIPAVIMQGLTLVVSPLIALMSDQVLQLSKLRIKAACIYSGMLRREIDVVLNNAVYGDIKLLYVSPERLQSRTFIDHLRQMNISMIAVDEAHCVSQWGYDFRPPYLEIARIRAIHPNAPVLALTATATPEVVDDIVTKLKPQDSYLYNDKNRQFKIFQSSFFRPNLSYSVLNEADKQGALLRIVRNVGGSGIVYVRNRKRTVEVARLLCDNDIPAAAYHAGMSMTDRSKRQKDWVASSRGVMVATNAFGMGIDKPNVRFVVHLDIPESPEAYFQEAGRAGRDGIRAYAVLLYHNGDIDKLWTGLERDFPPLQFIKNVYRGICNYYQVPVGAGTDSRFDFKLDDICETYGFDHVRFFSSLKFLEREGLISLPEHGELQSKLFIPISKDELYRFQVNNRVAGDMLTTILRLYGGLFTGFTPVSEVLIGRRCQMSEVQVCNMLFELSRLNIVEYVKRTVAPQIVFTSPRVDIKDLHISDRNYSELKNAAMHRRQAMVQYITSQGCRSNSLLAYFGETPSAPCGICDHCISLRKIESMGMRVPPNPFRGVTRVVCHFNGRSSINLAELILSTLKETPMTISQLVESIEASTSTMANSQFSGHVIETVRNLLDKGKLKMNQDFVISC